MNKRLGVPFWRTLVARAYGHGATVAPYASQAASALRDLALERPRDAEFVPAPWSTRVRAHGRELDGIARVRGELYVASRASAAASARRAVVVLVHGLGGDPRSHYIVRMAAAANAAGLDALAIALRGADGTSADFYHAGLSSDLVDAVRAIAKGSSASPGAYDDVFLVGYSLGGHLALRAATELAPGETPLRAAVAVCSPLDLAPAGAALDEPSRAPYRRFVLSYLKAHYARVAKVRPVPLGVAELADVVTFRQWDERVIAPYFGFESADRYYAEMSVGPRLGDLAVPGLLVAARHDPMIVAESIDPSAARAKALAGRFDLRWVERGGHLAFTGDLDLGEAGPKGLDAQLLAFFERHRG